MKIMKAADWIVNFLITEGVTDIFGLPGVAVLDLLYAMDRRKPELTPHLNYHEQGAAFAACGYAQVTGKLGVAYSTRGPGLTNMVTAMADAYYDSVPVMFFTAHNNIETKQDMRILNNQEMDTVSVVSAITKSAVRIDRIEDLQHEVIRAYELATSGRKGPVFLDILSSIFEMHMDEEKVEAPQTQDKNMIKEAAVKIAAAIRTAKRPIVLIGNGVRQSGTQSLIRQLASRGGIPVLSSRTAQDVMPDSPEYFGFVGSHATRYSNFILSKADVIVALGNRLSFPVNSQSFRPIVENAVTIRVDADEFEFLREVPNSINYTVDLYNLLPELLKQELTYSGKEEWMSVCCELRRELWQRDRMPVIDKLTQIMEAADNEDTFVCDVGNHSFWVTNAYAYSGMTNRILYSGSFGTLGSALPKAIGACYGTRHPVVCFTGDQGFQMNIQELQLISQYKLPVTIVVLNNNSSGMIREREKDRFDSYFVHTTRSSGYGVVNLRDIATAYRLEYRFVDALEDWHGKRFLFGAAPCLIELQIDEETDLFPNLPKGCACQDLAPALPRELYQRLVDL